MTEVGKYKIIKLLGAGQFGAVYHVTDRALGADKAIKLIKVPNPQEIADKLNEAQILYQCKHKHIVQVNEANVFVIQGDHYVCIDMEFVNSGSVEQLIASGHCSISDSIRIMIDVLQGLEQAHSLGYLHRDIKPANILLDNGIAKISDFGLAYDLKGGSYGSLQGYITHLAPESFATNLTSKLTDVFAAGMTLYRMVNNIKDWNGTVNALSNFQQKTIQGKLVDSIGFNEYVPKKLVSIIRKATSANPNKRYQSVSKYLHAIEKLRCGINWKRTTDFKWHGRDLSDNRSIVELEFDGRRSLVVFKRNNRTVKSRCRVVASDREALKFINRIVAESSLI